MGQRRERGRESENGKGLKERGWVEWKGRYDRTSDFKIWIHLLGTRVNVYHHGVLNGTASH